MRNLIILSLVVLVSCQNSGTYTLDANTDSISAPRQKTAEELREELRISEVNSPSKYLEIAGITYWRNLFDEFVLEGVITNNATVASFKDIVLQIDYLAPSGTVIATKEITKYHILAPANKLEFKYKAFVSDAASKPRITVIHADPH